MLRPSRPRRARQPHILVELDTTISSLHKHNRTLGGTARVSRRRPPLLAEIRPPFEVDPDACIFTFPLLLGTFCAELAPDWWTGRNCNRLFQALQSPCWRG
ncbi:hypothetical protein Micbo1qcDRAFT_44048 [Microdochium bolleyi]|uniref:Uncharacterized protein n=1 Tax=Microdochium bolleyi TaxID=196109 RepID=A0A136JB58_9PEZI|nr:hypothetical protein Micbo1qcDRAFT_44048 [Microdochium bolleyi]